MYKKEKSISMKGSASALCNNLSVLVCPEKNTINYAVVHKSVVNLVSVNPDGSGALHRQILCREPSATHGMTIVIQARLVQMAQRMLLVITSQKGIQIFEADGSLMLFWYSLGGSELNQGEMVACFGRGICAIQDDMICVGNHKGEILVFSIPARGTNIVVADTISAHKHPICDLESSGNELVSSDEHGNLTLWRVDDSFTPMFTVPGAGTPCTSVALWQNAIVAGYGSGHLRVFSTKSGKMSVEIAAHGRWITSVDVTESGKVLSASEDSVIYVWQLMKSNMPEIEHIYGESVTDLQIQGAKFTRADGKTFACTGYDSSELHIFGS